MASHPKIFNYPDFIDALPTKGANVVFEKGFSIISPENLYIGNNVLFNVGVFVQANKPVIIGDDTHFAPYCVLYGPLEVGNKCAVAAHTVFASVGHTYDNPEIPFVDAPAKNAKIILRQRRIRYKGFIVKKFRVLGCLILAGERCRPAGKLLNIRIV